MEMRGDFASLTARLPFDRYAGSQNLETDSDEILVIGDLAERSLAETALDEERVAARRRRIQDFRHTTRERRVKIGQEAEKEFGRKVYWGARCVPPHPGERPRGLADS